MNCDNITYFDSFGVQHIPKDVKAFIGNENITPNIYRIQASDSIMFGYLFIGFIHFMLKDKSLLGYAKNKKQK